MGKRLRPALLAPQDRGMLPVRLLKVSVTLCRFAMEPPVPQEDGSDPDSWLWSTCSPCRKGHARAPALSCGLRNSHRQEK